MNGVIAIGHDVIEIERIQATIGRYKNLFLSKIYTPEELHYCFRKGNPFPSLAVRFTAKEAVSKAFSCGIGKQLRWQSISIVNHHNGSPQVQLDALGEKLLHNLGGSRVMISLTHSCTIASAVALVI